MTKSGLPLLFFLAFGPFCLAQNAAMDVLGTWKTADGTSHVEIYERNSRFFGKIIWIKHPNDDQGKPITDDNGTPVMHMEFMKNFKWDDGAYEDGTVYDPESGKTYYGSMELEDKHTLKLRGSLDQYGFLGRTETWTRVIRDN